MKKVTEHKVCVLIFSTSLSETFLIQEKLREILSKMYIGLRVKCLLFLSDFNETCVFSTDFRKILKYQVL